MSWKDSQFIPEYAVIEAVIEKAVLPTIAAQREASGSALENVQITIWQANLLRSEWQFAAPTKPNSTSPDGELRLRFRGTFKTERSLFFGQMRLKSPIAATGYSGFSLRGSAKVCDSGIVVDVDPVTTEYNSTRWRDPF